jgi:hypothetical protein
MRQRSILECRQHRGLGVRRVVPDLMAARSVSDRGMSNAIASRMACDICSRWDYLPLGSSLPEGFTFMGSLPADSGADADEGSCPVLGSTIEASCRWHESVRSSERVKRAETGSKGLQLAQKLSMFGGAAKNEVNTPPGNRAVEQRACFLFARTP